jgi:hypothetical protein
VRSPLPLPLSSRRGNACPASGTDSARLILFSPHLGMFHSANDSYPAHLPIIDLITCRYAPQMALSGGITLLNSYIFTTLSFPYVSGSEGDWQKQSHCTSFLRHSQCS